MVNDKFMFFENFKSTADKLPDDMRLKFYDALTDYVFKGLEPEDQVIAALVNAFKPSLDKVERRGGNNNPHGQNQHSEVKTGQNRSKVFNIGQTEELSGQNEGKKDQEGRSFLETETETETETEVKNNLTVIKKEKSAKKFQKPTIDEIKAYCEETKNIIDPVRFLDFYESKGWKVGKSSMTDWKAAVRGWASRQRTMKAAASLLGVKSETYGGDIPL